MKKLAIALVILLAAGSVAARGYGAPPLENQSESPMDNTSNLSEGEAGENTSYQADLDVFGRTCATGEQNGSVVRGDLITRESFPPQHEVRFNGTVITSNPCSSLEHNVTKNGGSYTLNINSVSTGGPCVSCVGAVRYEARFEAVGEDFEELEIRHNDQTVDTISRSQPANESQNGSTVQNTTDNRSNMTQPMNESNRTDEWINVTGEDLNMTGNMSNETDVNRSGFPESLNESNTTGEFNGSNNTSAAEPEEENFSPQRETGSNGSEFRGPSGEGSKEYQRAREEDPQGVLEWLMSQVMELLELDV